MHLHCNLMDDINTQAQVLADYLEDRDRNNKENDNTYHVLS